jgi:glycogen operon protein
LRDWQVKNFLALTLLLAGAPMLLVGDEVRQTMNDNNKAYCHDDETKPRTPRDNPPAVASSRQ